MAADPVMNPVLEPSLGKLGGVLSLPRVTRGIIAAPVKETTSCQVSGTSALYMGIGGMPIVTEFWFTGTPIAPGNLIWMVPIAAPAPAQVPMVSVPRRSREMRFRQTHRDLFNSFAGQWVCLEGETLVARGSDLSKVVEEARKKAIQVPYIFRVSKEPEGSVRIGL